MPAKAFVFELKENELNICFSGATDVKLIKCFLLRVWTKPLVVNTQFQFFHSASWIKKIDVYLNYPLPLANLDRRVRRSHNAAVVLVK